MTLRSSLMNKSPSLSPCYITERKKKNMIPWKTNKQRRKLEVANWALGSIVKTGLDKYRSKWARLVELSTLFVHILFGNKLRIIYDHS